MENKPVEKKPEERTCTEVDNAEENGQLVDEENNVEVPSEKEVTEGSPAYRECEISIYEKLPPLLEKVEGQLVVLGFSPRDRRVFYKAVMMFGLPPEDAYNSQWCIGTLKDKTPEVFNAYSSLFMRHLAEPERPHCDVFLDGLPREGLRRTNVLTRIGIMNVIRRKVEEFAVANGEWSVPEDQEKTVKLARNLTAAMCQSNIDPRSNHPISTYMADGHGGLQRKREVPSCVFNIADGAFTELHTLWVNEEKAANPGKEFEIWHRRHDYWLLAGIVQFGYGRYQDIQSDVRYAIVNKPFDVDKTGNYQEIKNKFLQRRFKLLEQALVIEEQLSRVDKFKFPTSDCDNKTLTEALEHIANEDVTNTKENMDTNLVKALSQLEGILSDLHSDVSHHSVPLSQLQPVGERVGLSNRGILSRAISPDEASGQSVSSLSDAFESSDLNEHLARSQPQFRALIGKNIGKFEIEVDPDVHIID